MDIEINKINTSDIQCFHQDISMTTWKKLTSEVKRKKRHRHRHLRTTSTMYRDEDGDTWVIVGLFIDFFLHHIYIIFVNMLSYSLKVFWWSSLQINCQYIWFYWKKTTSLYHVFRKLSVKRRSLISFSFIGYDVFNLI